ncbi:uncharacterized protein VTP21DRAFT_4963 [Calcarisporiella thermophila]|uniref:uncharacterized protein n=1 Tax=Calcarisporiella thermophila TaxID=911321 RepID=UPI003742C508
MPLVTMSQAATGVLKKDGVIPDVIDEFNASTLLTIAYGDHEVIPGAKFTTAETQSAPKVTFHPEEDVKYTLAMTDPDAPSRENPKSREFRHWVITDIQASDAEHDASKNARTLSAYYPPSPPAGTGPHRYCFLLWKQTMPETKFAPLSDEASGRRNWSARKFAKENGLELVAATFFNCEHA